MQSDVNFPLVLCKPTSQIIQPKFNQCKRFVLRPHFPVIYLTISILGSSTIFGLSLKYTLRFVPSTSNIRTKLIKQIKARPLKKKPRLFNILFSLIVTKIRTLHSLVYVGKESRRGCSAYRLRRESDARNRDRNLRVGMNHTYVYRDTSSYPS